MRGSAKGLSLTARLAVTTAAMLFTLTAAIGLAANLQFRVSLQNHFDNDLVSLLDEIEQSESGSPGRAGSDDQLLDAVATLSADRLALRGDIQAQVLSPGNAVLAESSTGRGQPTSVSFVSAAQLEQLAGGSTIVNDITLNAGEARFAARRLDDGTGRILAVGLSATRVTGIESLLLRVYLQTAAIGTVFGGVITAIMVKRGLAPIGRVAADAEAIGAHDLTLRIPVTGHRDEVGDLILTLNRMLDGLESAIRRERAFVSYASHEIRTPLAIARAETELVHDVLTDERLRAGLTSALEEIDRLAALVEDLLLLARADERAVPDHTQIVDLGELVTNVVKRLRVIADRRQISLEATGGSTVMGDAPALERAVGNLVSNAIRHIPDGGKVSVVVENRDDNALIVVRDNGPGVEPGLFGTLFDRFARGGSGTAGAGLGLAIVAVVATAHRGNVKARNLPEGGLEIAIELDRGDVARGHN